MRAIRIAHGDSSSVGSSSAHTCARNNLVLIIDMNMVFQVLSFVFHRWCPKEQVNTIKAAGGICIGHSPAD
jgi:hypothetical protein